MDIDLYKILIIVAIERNNIMANNDFIIWAKNNNWNIILNSDKSDLPNSIKSRYNIPKQWYDFICGIQVCENDNATKWFLTPRDYLPNEEGFQWNEFEIQSLEYGTRDYFFSTYSWCCFYIDSRFAYSSGVLYFMTCRIIISGCALTRKLLPVYLYSGFIIKSECADISARHIYTHISRQFYLITIDMI